MRQSTKIDASTRGFHAFLPCRAAVVAQDRHLRGGVIRRHRAATGSLWRKLNPGQQALLVLACLREGDTDDSHADDIVQMVREVFAKGNEFATKITYRTRDGRPQDLLQSFRNSLYPRIVVTVDMIATGTDVKPLECLLFMRSVKSRTTSSR